MQIDVRITPEELEQLESEIKKVKNNGQFNEVLERAMRGEDIIFDIPIVKNCEHCEHFGYRDYEDAISSNFELRIINYCKLKKMDIDGTIKTAIKCNDFKLKEESDD